jgi:hypothetical protein
MLYIEGEKENQRKTELSIRRARVVYVTKSNFSNSDCKIKSHTCHIRRSAERPPPDPAS